MIDNIILQEIDDREASRFSLRCSMNQEHGQGENVYG